VCGLVAFLADAAPRDRARLAAQVAAARRVIARRGPDGEGAWTAALDGGGAVGLFHARLAMTGGDDAAQPLVDGAGPRAHVLVTNGEVYGDPGYARRADATSSDAEHVLAAYRARGVDGVLDVSSELACVVWDGPRGALVGTRDRFGVRPLVYARHAGVWWLASTPRALFAAGVPRVVDEAALETALEMQYLPPGRTLFAGVFAVEPGEALTLRPGDERPRLERRVVPRLGGAREAPSIEAAEHAVRAALEDAVRARLTSSRALGFQLSGGVDSSAVVALAHRAGVAAPRCYSVRFVGHPLEVDEAPWARCVAESTGAALTFVDVGPEQVAARLEDVIAEACIPAIDAHVVAKAELARRARADGVVGLLTGEGADEVFAGYAHLQPIASSAPTRAGLHVALGEALPTDGVAAVLGDVPAWWRAKASLGHRVARYLRVDWRAAQAEARAADVDSAPMTRVARTLDATWRAHVGAPIAAASPLDRAQWTWTRVALGGSILPAVGDGPELAEAVEGRLPFLDARVVDRVWSWPEATRRPPGEKALLRGALRGLLPEAVRLRPKHPFLAPPLLTGTAIGRAFFVDVLTRAARSCAWLAPDAATRLLADVDAAPDAPSRRALEPAAFLLTTLALITSAGAPRIGGEA
jgi:asparagine synthase (glutamine-hydrolysing)